MKLNLFIFLLVTVCVFVLISATVSAETYYVSKNGNDSNDGTTSWHADSAWLTLDNLNDTSKFHCGDSVVIGAGIYRGTIYIPRLNSSSADKTYYLDSAWVAGTTDSRVAWIYGSDSLHTWTNISGEIYRCSYTPTLMNNQVGIWQGDSCLFRQTSNSLSEGQTYYANDSVYAWVYGGGDPDELSEPLEVGQRPCVVYTPELESGSGLKGFSSDNWVLQGLGFKYSNLWTICSNNTGRDELGFDSCLISHCYIGCNSGAGGSNASLIYTPRCGQTGEYDPFDSEDLDGADYNRITACSLAWNYNFNTSLPQGKPPDVKSFNGGGMNFYTLRYSVIDSNTFFGDLLDDAAIKFKVANDADDGGATYDTIRFNLFDAFSDAQLIIWSGTHHFAIYGNIFQTPVDVHTYDLLGAGIMLQNSAIGSAGAGYHKVCNNTFYNVADLPLYVIDNGKYEFPAKEMEFNRNIVYQATGLNVVDIDSTKFWVNVDSNMYYAASGTNTWETDSASDMTFSGWQGQGMDSHSTDDVDPGFDSVAAVNPWLGFARSGASAEMNESYGGKTWTLFGAVQETKNNVFFSKNGNDSNDGSSWEQSKLTFAALHPDSLSGVDTVFFGEGLWQGVTIKPPDREPSGPIVYACSAYVSGQKHITEIWNGEEATGFTQLSGNVYWKSDSDFDSGTEADHKDAVWQADSSLLRVSSIASLVAGKYYANGTDTFAVYLYDTGSGYNPSSYTVVTSHGSNESDFCVWNFSGADNVHVRGIDSRYACVIVDFTVSSDDDESDTVSFENCTFSHAHYYGGGNPSIFLTSSRVEADNHEEISFVSCSLYNVCSTLGANSEYIDETHGALVTTYGVSHSLDLFKDCYFGGPTARCFIWLKNDNPQRMRNVGIHGCVFDSLDGSAGSDERAQIEIARAIDTIWIYQNKFFNFEEEVGGNGASILICNGEDDEQDLNGYYMIMCNTFFGTTDVRVVSHTECSKTDVPRNDCLFYYNLVYNPSHSSRIQTIDSSLSFDYNGYDANTIYRYFDGSSRTFAYWNDTLGFSDNADTNMTLTFDSNWDRTNIPETAEITSGWVTPDESDTLYYWGVTQAEISASTTKRERRRLLIIE